MTDSDNLEHEEQIQELTRRYGVKVADWGRKVTPEEIQWLLDHCPFLQMTAQGYFEPYDEPKIITASSSNWQILDYGNALGSSPGQLIFGGGYFHIHDDDGSGGSGVVNPGKGTIVNQAFMTAQEMVRIAIARGWKGVHLVDYHRLMARSAWMEAMSEGFPVSGFTPDRHDQRVRKVVGMSLEEIKVSRFGRSVGG